jgi:hypothetical protein
MIDPHESIHNSPSINPLNDTTYRNHFCVRAHLLIHSIMNRLLIHLCNTLINMCACSPLNPGNSRQPTEWEGDANGTFLELRPEEPDSDAVKENGLFLCITIDV